MKQTIRIFLLLTILCLGTVSETWAVVKTLTQSGFTVYVNQTPDDGGTVSISGVTDRTITLNVEPATGYSISANLITAEPMYVLSSSSSAPQRAPGLMESLTITANDATHYSFVLPSDYTAAYVTVTFYKGTISSTTKAIRSLDEIDETENEGIVYQMVSDIDASGWESIADFKGTLDGNFYKIKNLSVPLFSSTSGSAVIRNITFEDVSINLSSGDAGAVAANAGGSTRIYNCGILATPEYDIDGNLIGFNGSTVSGSGNVGGLVGTLSDNARVINCYSYATITGGSNVGGIVGYNSVASSQTNVATMVMNCMFYGDIIGGSTVSPVYGGENINNLNPGGLATYNYYAYSQLKTKDISDGKYNCALAMEERFLNRCEIYRQLLNSNKKLAAIYATGSAANSEQMAKWVLETADRQINNPMPYPVLRKREYNKKYPSIINYDAKHAPDSASVGRNHGGKVNDNNGRLAVTIYKKSEKTTGGLSWPSDADVETTSLSLIRTDKDFDRYNYNYDKVQLPYYNDVGTGNYTENRVVTGWKIVSVSGGTQGTFSETDAWGGYNFADRKCTDKDVYSVSGRVFSQGAYFDVPYGVTGITIEPYWGKAAYVSDKYYDVVYSPVDKDHNYSSQNVEGHGTQYSFAKVNNVDQATVNINGDPQIVYTSIETARSKLNISTSETVYDYAVVLVGNVHQAGPLYGNGNNQTNTPYTIMSVDLDKDNEPDYSFIFSHHNRQAVTPIRFDFLNVPGTAQAQKPNGATQLLNVSIFNPRGWFEVTNTCSIYITQFEADNGNMSNSTKTAAPVIFLGGVIDQYTSTKDTEIEKSDYNNRTQYIHLGSNACFKDFGNGTHSDGWYATRHVPVSVTGGDFDGFYLSGVYRPDAQIMDDDAEGYISGGRFKEVAGAAQQMINGNVRFQIYNADITNFYGGGINAEKPITGNVTVDIFNSHVDTYCGGPKFGDMQKGGTTFITKYSNNKTGTSTGTKEITIAEDGIVTTTATGCTFGKFFGAGYGGASSYKLKYYDQTDKDFTTTSGFTSLIANYNNDRGKYYDGQNNQYKTNYGNKGPGVATDFDYEFFVWSSGIVGARFYVYYTTFSMAKTNNVYSYLTKCTVNENFYGGGSLGVVNGTATSELTDCNVKGSVYGGGYSASIPSVPVRATGFAQIPIFNANSGIFEIGKKNGTDNFKWKNATLPGGGANALVNGEIPTDVNLDNLGQVTETKLTVLGNTTVDGSVYGGGEESNVSGDTQVNVNATYNETSHKWESTSGSLTITGDVFGAGKGVGDNFACDKAMVGVNDDGKCEDPGSDTNKDKGTIVRIGNGTVNGNVYGGGKVGRVEWNTQVTIGIEGEDSSAPVVSGSVFGAGAGLETHGYSALVRGNSTVTVQGSAKVLHNVYGGGEKSTVGRYWVKGIETTLCPDDPNETAIPTPPTDLPDGMPYQQRRGGICNVVIRGKAQIGPDSGGTEDAGHVFGAGKGVTPIFVESGEGKSQKMTQTGLADFTADATHATAEDAYLEFLQTLALVTNSNVTIGGSAKVKGSVYGGSESGYVQHNTKVIVSGGTIGTAGKGGADFGNVYGGGKGDAEHTGTNNNYLAAGIVKGYTEVKIEDGTILHNIYGGGAYGTVGVFDYNATTGQPTGLKSTAPTNSGKTEIYITGGTIGTTGKENGMIFGSSRGDVGAPNSIHDKLAWVYDTHVAIGDTATNATITTATPLIKGSVYGGGENGHNLNNAYVRINGGTIGIKDNTTTEVTYNDDVTDPSKVTYTGYEYNYPYRGNVYGGGCGTDTYKDGAVDKYNPLAGVVKGNAFVNITAGYIVHNVYGAGAMGSVGTDVADAKTKVNISGGRIGYDGSRNGNVFGAARGEYGTSTDLSKNLANVRETEVNINYTTTPAADNTEKTVQLIAGSVFGGGEAGTVKESVAVNMTGGLILKDIYGGGALADTQTSNWDASANSGAGYWATGKSSASATTTVRLMGGRVVEEVYGGGLGEANKPAFVWGDVLVDLNGTTTLSGGKATANGTKTTNATGCAVGQIFGGNNINGTPKGDVMVHVYATQNAAATQIANAAASGTEGQEGYTPAVTTAKVKGRYDVMAVYGGGNQAAYIPVTPNTSTTSTPNGSQTQVIIEGCDYTSVETVYGGGNAAAVPETNVEVRAAYEIGTVFGGGNGYSATDNHADPSAPNYNPGADIGVYKEGTTETTYGTGDANAILKGGFIHEAYGGSNQKGNIKGKININTNPQGTCDLCVDKLVGAGKNADVDGDLIMVLGCKPTTKTPLVFAGADNADVNGNVELTITSGTFGQVFGGNNLGGHIKGHIKLNIEETGCNPIVIDELYLGGNQAAYSRYGYYNAGTTENPNIQPRTAAMHAITNTSDPNYKAPITNPSNDDNKHPFPYAQPELNVISCTSIGKVFGGGLGTGAVMHADPTVNINMIKGTPNGTESSTLGTIGDVYGGGNAASVMGNTTVNIGTGTTVTLTSIADDPTTTEVNESVKTVLGANITGNVFGGGNEAKVSGNTYVNICGTQIADSNSENGYTDTSVDHTGTTGFSVSIGNSVYGGGNAADVEGNTFVTFADGYVFNGIFGGGLAGSVGTYTKSTNVTDWGHTANHAGCIGKPTACTAGGTCYIVVSGGQIGPIEVATQGQGMNRLDADGGPVPQGWVWGAGCGLVEDPATHPDTHFKAYVNNTDVTIKGNAFILESIIGGGEFGRVLGNTLVKIQGGQIGVGEGQVDNGKPVRYTDGQFVDPTTTTITTGLATCSHFPFGKEVGGKKVYDCYDPYADAYKAAHSGSELYPGGVTDGASDGKTWIGCVFAGGSGYMPYVHKDGSGNVTDYDWVRSAGWVEGNTEVRISGGHILSNVYGGNEYTDVKGTSKVIMTGGTVGVPRTEAQIKALPMCGYIYGAGKGDERIHFNTSTNVGSAEVEVSGGIVYGSVYGGGEDGHVLGDAKVTIMEGAKIGSVGTSYFDGNVFGGGRGFSGIAQTAGTVGGNVEVNIEGGKMLGSVYGGGRLASVGTMFEFPTLTSGDPNPAYGQFKKDGDSKTYGHVTVNISGGTIGNENATGDGAKYSGNVFGGSMGRLELLDGTRNPIWAKMAQVKSTAVNIYDEAVVRRNVFGGGELGTVRDDAYVTIGGYKTDDANTNGEVPVTTSLGTSGSGPIVRRDVYGGGYGSDNKTHNIFSVYELTDADADPSVPANYDTNPHVYAYTPMQFAGCVGKNTYVNVVGGYIRKSVYGGGEMASVGVINYRAAELTSGTSTDGKVWFHDAASNKDYYYTNMVKHEDATKEFALSWPYKFEYVTGYPGATHVKVTGGRLGLITEGGRFGLSGADTDTGFDDNGDVYGAGKGMAGDFNDYLFCANVGSTDVVIDHAASNDFTAYSGSADLIAGAVYGGGEDGHVIGNTKVTLEKGFVYHSIYGGGSGKGKYDTNLLKIGSTSEYYPRNVYSITAGKVFGNSTVVMNGGTVVRNVYGGGNMGSVGKGNYAGGSDDYSTDGYGEKVSNLWSNTDFLGSGKCTVKITGGTIGYIDTTNPLNSMYPYNSPASLPYGNVFGGCRGEAAPDLDVTPSYLYSPEFFMGYANETEVTIEGSTTKILASVYGGGMDGHVRRDASVTIKGGEIGKTFDATSTLGNDPNNIQWQARGNVYGAGSGIGEYNASAIQYSSSYTGTQLTGTGKSTSAGSVTGSTTVDIQGGTIRRNVYGGGSLASVGAPKIPADRTDNPTKAQTLNTVTISGGHIGGDYSYSGGNHVYGGHVFGGSRGDATLDATKFSTSMFTSVSINANADETKNPIVYGSVFGGGEVGIVKGSVDVTMNGGTVNDDVYGGGALANTNTENSSSVPYTTTVNLYGGMIKGDAYGGGLGQLGVTAVIGVHWTAEEIANAQEGDPAYGKTTDDWKVAPVVGVEAKEAMVYGNVAVNLGDDGRNGATAFYVDKFTEGTHAGIVKSGRVFGCNNLNGSPQGNVTVTVNKTVEGNTPKTDSGDLKSSDATKHSYHVAAVYGGGNLAGKTVGGSTYVVINGCDVSIRQVYGGGNAAEVPGTDVLVNGTWEIEQVFGGGNGKDDYTLDGGTTWITNPGANVNGNTNTLMKGGLIHEAYGGSNEKGTITGSVSINTSDDRPTDCDCELDVEKIVGAGKNADVNGDLIMVLGCKPTSKTPLVFGGADNANVNGNVELTITSGTFGQVFGGNNLGGIIKGHILLNIEETGCNPIKIDELYLGGNQAAYSVYGYYDSGTTNPATGKKIYLPRTSASDSHTADPSHADDATHSFPYADPVLNVVSCTSIGKVFGGGLGEGAVMYADPTVNINMIPGDFASDVPDVMTTKGLSADDNPKKLGIIGDVYGGGNAADVIGNPTVNIGTAETVRLHRSYSTTTGYVMSDPIPVEGAYINGNVFGGGKGIADSFLCNKAMVGVTDQGFGSTHVTIENGTVNGSVYGGGMVGRVEHDTSVTIGKEGDETNNPVVKGDVFGAGKGLKTHGYSALVRGKATVTVQGKAQVEGSVYGGGEIASVGRYNVKKGHNDPEGAPDWVPVGMPYSLYDETSESGNCIVIVRDNAIIGPETPMQMKKTGDPDDTGHVFGAGKGVLPYEGYGVVGDDWVAVPWRMAPNNTIDTYSESEYVVKEDGLDYKAAYLQFIETLALATETNVNISGNAFVKGSVYGGSMNGHVQHHTRVTITGGQIGAGDGMSQPYKETDWTGETTPTGGWKECAHWDYVDNGAPYDPLATTEGTYDYTNYPFIPETDRLTSSEGGLPKGTDGHTYYGNVFGGGSGVIPYAPGLWHRASGSVGGDSYVTITGGHILTSVYGGNEQTDVGTYTKDDPTVPATGGKCTITMTGGTVGVPLEHKENYPVTGHLFGAGKGDKRILFNTWTNVAETDVNVSGGTIYGNVYGGGEDGHVMGLSKMTISEADATTNPTIIGTIGLSGYDGDVFGGGQGSVTALTAGVVGGNVNLSIEGGTMKGSVYGGGRLASVGTFFATAKIPDPSDATKEISNPQYGRMQDGDDHGNIVVNLTGGTIKQNVFGGCMGSTTDNRLGVSKNVTVNLNGYETTTGETTTTVIVADDKKGCVVKGSVFGCNNLESSPLGDVLVHVYGTQKDGASQIANTAGSGETAAVENAKTPATQVAGEFDLSSFDVKAVYGGGNLAAYKPQGPNVTPTDYDYANTTHFAKVIIDGCGRTSIGQVYGGGNAASTPATEVTVNGTYEIGELFGGGNGKDDVTINGVTKPNPGANVGYYNYSQYVEKDGKTVVEDMPAYDTKEKRLNSDIQYGTGKAAVNIFGGTIHRVFGGSNTKGNVRQSAITLLEEAGGCDFCVDEAYGGGKSAPMDAEAKLLMACIPGLKAVYGGAQAADVYDDVTVTVTNGNFDRVFGGNNLSGTIRGKITVNVEETGCRPVIIGELYGGGNQAGYSVYGYNEDGSMIESGDTPLYQDPQVNVRSFTSIGNIYGGGYGKGAKMVGNPTVNINVVEGDKKDYTYANDASTYKVGEDNVPYYDANGFKELTLTVDDHSVVLPSHTKGKIGAINNVFGGGNAAEVIGNTNVNVGTLAEVYQIRPVATGNSVANYYTRSGEGTESSPYIYTQATGNAVDGTTYYEKKTVIGADIRGNVYGGGNNAQVTGNTNVNIGKKEGN